MNWASIELLVLDVDGVLTDGRILSSAEGGWEKSFYVQDGCATKLWSQMGGQVAIISGRSEPALDRRAAELGIQTVCKGVSDKTAALDVILSSSDTNARGVAYVGDDLPDLGPMSRVTFPVAVANAHPAVKRSAMYITRRKGGRGAVAEVVEFLLRKQGRWSTAFHTAIGVDRES
ncbi:MAG: HAD hydrolase family protein [Planctomycetes bacterium]|nr:HAD hydrolase family protein [Planctomycetota bacterium]MCH9034514.1 HAD hydrolase family protein [Planctomycetota bacterium]